MKHDRRVNICPLCECSSVTKAILICIQYITFTPAFKSLALFPPLSVSKRKGPALTPGLRGGTDAMAFAADR
jgi:hypothetical protein